MKKKLFSTLILVTLLASVLPSVCTVGAEPITQDLMAGKTLEVGEVTVWNDASNIYVKYEITLDGWRFSELHLEIDDVFTDIHQSNGNPVPGQFAYSQTFAAPYVTEYTFTVPKNGWSTGTILYVVAHAKVVHVVDGSQTIVSDTSTMWSGDNVNWYNTISVTPHPAWTSIPGATWVWLDPANLLLGGEYANTPGGGWYFKKGFTLPTSAFDISADMVAGAADNAYRIAINGVALVPPGHGQMLLNPPTITQDDFDAFMQVNTHTVPDDTITAGANWIQIRALNWYGDANLPAGNPAGLIYKAVIDYSYIDKTETAWGAGTGFSGKNWATYFTYTVQGNWVLLETLTVDSTSVTGTTSNTVLDSGKTYKFKAIGTWTNTVNNVADAEYTSKDNWATHADGYIWPPYAYLGANFGDLQVGSTFINWGSYSASHVYDYEHAGTGTTVTFRVFDGEDPNPVPSWYGDNSGSLTVDIFIWQ